MELTGTLFEKVSFESKAKKTDGSIYYIATLVLQYEDSKYPKCAVFSRMLMNDSKDSVKEFFSHLKTLEEGKRYKVMYDIGSHKFQDKWYCQLDMWKVEEVTEENHHDENVIKASEIQNPDIQDNESDELPF